MGCGEDDGVEVFGDGGGSRHGGRGGGGGGLVFDLVARVVLLERLDREDGGVEVDMRGGCG